MFFFFYLAILNMTFVFPFGFVIFCWCSEILIILENIDSDDRKQQKLLQQYRFKSMFKFIHQKYFFYYFINYYDIYIIISSSHFDFME